MNILHLTTFLQGGAGRIIASLAIEQCRAGHDVTVVTSKSAPAGYGNYSDHLDRLKRAGVPVHLVDSMFARDYASNLAVVQYLADRFDRSSPDLMHAHAAIPSLVALLFAGARRTPPRIVQTMHGWGVRKTTEQAAIDTTLMNLVHHVVVPSVHAREQMTALGVRPTQITVVPYGVGDVEVALTPSDRALVADMARARRDGRLVAACVGTIGERKNQTQLIDAVRLLEGALDVLCVFIGDGDVEELAASVARAGVAGACRFHGYSPAARQMAATADVLVLPSRNEGQPIAVIEAFADGVLVAVSDTPELRELVSNDVTGLVFALDDPASLAETLKKVAALAPADRAAIRTRARSEYESRFTPAAMVERYMAIYSGSQPGARHVRTPAGVAATRAS